MENAIPYLVSMGIGAVYASPLFVAVPGSNHGYDITDPLRFNPEIGNAEEFTKIIRKLKNRNIGWIQDIVPNHMAFHPQNPWLRDVLKNGTASEYARFFDIDWDHPAYKNKVMVPVLADSLENCISMGQLVTVADSGEISLDYSGFILPINESTIVELAGNKYSPQEFSKKINADKILFKSLLAKQHYVLTHWQETESSINFRRFFTINGLISLRMDDPSVFDSYHEFILKMVREGKIGGLRLDHIDGLKKPAWYISMLRAAVGEETYIIAEKILEADERLDISWPIQGSTGYDFMTFTGGLFTGTGISRIASFYTKTTGMAVNTANHIYEKKTAVLQSGFTGDLENICRLIHDNKLIPLSSSITYESVKAAVGEFLVYCPVYKLYSDRMPLMPADRISTDAIIEKAIKSKPSLKPSLIALRNLFSSREGTSNPAIADLFLRMMQYTGPLMAKGVEDTAMYNYTMFIARNEVGDSISAPPLTIQKFHLLMIDRRDSFPASLNATATHDTKRGEDSRARLAVLSDIPDDWIRFYSDWNRISAKYTVEAANTVIPDENEKYFIAQTILGALPMDGKHDSMYKERLNEYLRKALREAKIHSDWNNPDNEYEEAVISFTNNMLIDKSFQNHIKPLFEKLRDFGIVNSLSQIVLKCTCPGIPDFYQGTELWDLSFVDPDNRRPVDFDLRKKTLNELKKNFRNDQVTFFSRLYRDRFSGSIKLWLIHRLMSERAGNKEMFVNASYLPLETNGPLKSKILAFARVDHKMWYLIIVPLHMASEGGSVFSPHLQIRLPLHAPRKWTSVWDDNSINVSGDFLEGHLLPFGCPLVLKASGRRTERGSGVLMHITSLPGAYGSGSLGAEAFEFVKLLEKSGQKFWQILPVNPAGLSNSPYSSPSAFAGNTVLIDPRMLLQENHLRKLPPEIQNTGHANFRKAMNMRIQLLNEVYENFTTNSRPLIKNKFRQFCLENDYWLEDFALFTLISQQYGQNWTRWPRHLNHYDRAVKVFNKHHEAIEKIQFAQFIFHEQFIKLKSFTTSFGIKIIGDLPIYVSYHSADVWAHPELFNLTGDLGMKTMAGVPPDFFSATGQLWRMPVYNWGKMREQDYRWWKKRIAKNLEYSDLLRFDHFRALSAFWEVPAGEKTAKNGQWIKGPGADFLNALKADFPVLPFIAEDLGDIDDDVLKLRDRFKLPGMKVLMFAFDETMPSSYHIPHNYVHNSIVYTGTHDNNTVKGWYLESNNKLKQRVAAYTGMRTDARRISWDMIRMAQNSVADIAIIPAQDLLSLNESARMNTPARAKGNWTWRLSGLENLGAMLQRLYEISYYSGRI